LGAEVGGFGLEVGDVADAGEVESGGEQGGDASDAVEVVAASHVLGP
jgi:hypothetical protein